MQTLIFLFILLPCLVFATSEPKKTKKVSTEPGRAAIEAQAKCNDALNEINGNINKGLGCGKRQEVKAAATEIVENEDLASFGMAKEAPVVGYYAQTNLWSTKGNTDVIKDLNEKDLALSVMTPDQARKLHSDIMNQYGHKMRLNELRTGCAPRSHLLGLAMAQRGIAAGKLWIEPKLLSSIDPLWEGAKEREKAKWIFHVVPFILVEVNGKTEKWVIDPAISRKGPLPYNEYMNRMSADPSNLTVRTSNRYVYDRDQRWNSSIRNDTETISARAASELECIRTDARNGTSGCKPAEVP